MILGVSGTPSEKLSNGLADQIPSSKNVFSLKKDTNVARLLHLKVVYDPLLMLPTL